MKNQQSSKINGMQGLKKQEGVMAKAKYRNIADTPDELSFGQGDIVTILERNYDGLDGWWLCQLHGEVGLVPANYFEIYDPNAIPVYDFPPNNKEAPSNATVQVLASPLASPKRNSNGSAKFTTEATLGGVATSDAVVLYDLPPSDSNCNSSGVEPIARTSPQLSARSSPRRLSPQLGARSPQLSARTDALRSSCGSIPLYDTPPTSRKASLSVEPYDFPPESKSTEAMKIYDTPRSHSPYPRRDHTQPDRLSIIPISMDCLFDEDADKLLDALHNDIGSSYEELCECVYGPSAVWDKERRQATLQRTVNSVVRCDQCLVNFLEFGKGVSNVLETFKDTHLRIRFNESYASLLQKRLEILAKFDLLIDGREIVDPITTTVKSLLEIAKTTPGGATELVVLIRANKTILFKQQPRARSASSLPRVVEPRAKLSLDQPPRMSLMRSVSSTTTEYQQSSIDRRNIKRNPKDVLPPLPLDNTSPQEQTYNLLKAKALAPSVTEMLKRNDRDYEKLDMYDDLKWDHQRPPASSHTSRDSHISLNSVGSENDEPDYPRHHPVANGEDSESLESGYFSFDHTPSLSRDSSSPKPISKQDQQLMGVFAMQLDAMSLTLVDSIDTFLRSIDGKSSPTNFVPYSKQTIVCAYKLVYIANILFQKMSHSSTKASIAAASSEMVEAIKLVVSDTKTAALQFPNVQAMQRMAESVNNLNPVASDLVKVTHD